MDLVYMEGCGCCIPVDKFLSRVCYIEPADADAVCIQTFISPWGEKANEIVKEDNKGNFFLSAEACGDFVRVLPTKYLRMASFAEIEYIQKMLTDATDSVMLRRQIDTSMLRKAKESLKTRDTALRDGLPPAPEPQDTAKFEPGRRRLLLEQTKSWSQMRTCNILNVGYSASIF